MRFGQLRAPHGKMIVAGKHYVLLYGTAVFAEPLGGNARSPTLSDVPGLGKKQGRPRSPGFGRVIDAKAAFEARSATRNNLAPEMSFERGVVTDPRSVTAAAMSETELERLP